jgi:hypothetical protein
MTRAVVIGASISGLLIARLMPRSTGKATEPEY